MTDEEILKYCKNVLYRDKSISVAWQLIHELKQKDGALIRRIRNKLLESADYTETSEEDIEGFKRIRKVKRSVKEKFPLVYDVIVGSTGGVIGAIATNLFDTKESQLINQYLQQLDNRVAKIEKTASLKDSSRITPEITSQPKHSLKP